MKNFTSNLLLSFCVLTFFSFKPQPLVLPTNTDASTIIWTGSKPTGSHSGNVSLTSGYLVLDHEDVVGGNFIIADLTYLETTNQTHLIEGV